MRPFCGNDVIYLAWCLVYIYLDIRNLTYFFKNLYPVPTSPPLYLSPVASTSTSVTLSWAPPPTQFQNGVIMGYTLQVFNSQQGLLRETNTSSNGSSVNSLRPYTTYLFRVAAMTVAGRGPYSGSVTVVTEEGGRYFGISHSFSLSSHRPCPYSSLMCSKCC